MDRRSSLGQDGTTVSAIGLGCMGMSEFYGRATTAQSLDPSPAALEHGNRPLRHRWTCMARAIMRN